MLPSWNWGTPQVLDKSKPERLRIKDSIELARIGKEEKKIEKEKMEQECAALKETLQKISKEEEKELSKKEDKKCHSMEISQMVEEFQEE